MDWKRSRSWVAENLIEEFDFPEGSLLWKKQQSASSGSTMDSNISNMGRTRTFDDAVSVVEKASTMQSPDSRQTTDNALRLKALASRSTVEAVLREVVANSSVCLSVAEPNVKDEGPEGIFVAVSEEFAAMTGYLADEMVGKSWRFLSGNNTGHESDPYSLVHLRLACQTGAPFTALRTNRRKSGELFLNMFHVRGLLVSEDENSEPSIEFLLGVHTDATDACAEDEERANSYLEEEADKVLKQISVRLSATTAPGARS